MKEFARDISGADIKAHAQVILNSNDVNYNYRFAKDVEGADVKAHGKIIIKRGTLWDNYSFARDVEGADIKAHAQVILDSQDIEHNYLFAKNVKGADIKAHAQVVLNKYAHTNYQWESTFEKEIEGVHYLAEITGMEIPTNLSAIKHLDKFVDQKIYDSWISEDELQNISPKKVKQKKLIKAIFKPMINY